MAKGNEHRQGGGVDGGEGGWGEKQEGGRQNRNAKRECSLMSVEKFKFALLPQGGSQKILSKYVWK